MSLYAIDSHGGEFRLASASGKPMPNRQLRHDLCQNLPFSNRPHVRRSAATCNILKAVLVQIAQNG